MPPLSSKAAFLRRVSATQMVSLFDLVPEHLFFIKDRAGRFVAMNRSLCDYCGLRNEHEAYGRTDYDFFPKSRADQYQKDDETVMSTGQALVNRVECAPAPEGSPRLVSTTKVPLRDSRGRIIGLIGFARPLDQVRETPANATRLAKVVEAMHLHPEAVHRSTELARLVGLSASQFDRCFRATFGTTAHHYLLRVRVEAVCRRLAESSDTVAHIAQECGFCDHAHLARSFRQVMNMTAKDYRQAHQRPRVE